MEFGNALDGSSFICRKMRAKIIFYLFKETYGCGMERISEPIDMVFNVGYFPSRHTSLGLRGLMKSDGAD